MSSGEIVRRPKLEPHTGTDPNTDWRRFVLEQVGYDEVARDRAARRMLRREALRRFGKGLIGGLALYALAFVVVLAALCWREGRFDRYMPHTDAPVDGPTTPIVTREAPLDPAESRDTHVIQKNPFDTPARPAPADADGNGAPQADAAPADDSSN